MSDPFVRSSDRWVTPGVIIAALLVVGFVVSLLIVAVAWVTQQGIDADPMLRLIGEIVTAVSALGALALQLANRSSVTKTERNTGQLKTETAALAGAMYEVADALPRPVPRHAYAGPYPPTVEAPAPRGG